jgi:hypothetical protein
MSSLVNLLPFAVRPKEAAKLAGCGITVLYRRLNEGLYESFLDGQYRLVVVESILAHQRRQLEATRGTPRTKPLRAAPTGGGRPRKTAAANQLTP